MKNASAAARALLRVLSSFLKLLLTAAGVGLVEDVVMDERRDVDELRDLPQRALRRAGRIRPRNSGLFVIVTRGGVRALRGVRRSARPIPANRWGGVECVFQGWLKKQMRIRAAKVWDRAKVADGCVTAFSCRAWQRHGFTCFS